MQVPEEAAVAASEDKPLVALTSGFARVDKVLSFGYARRNASRNTRTASGSSLHFPSCLAKPASSHPEADAASIHLLFDPLGHRPSL